MECLIKIGYIMLSRYHGRVSFGGLCDMHHSINALSLFHVPRRTKARNAFTRASVPGTVNRPVVSAPQKAEITREGNMKPINSACRHCRGLRAGRRLLLSNGFACTSPDTF